MERPIMKDPIFLAQKSAPAAAEDLETARDLLDTLTAHKDGCVGMAANMIGVRKRIIVFDNEGRYMTMFNPEIVRRAQPYEAEEGCLSLSGKRKTKSDFSSGSRPSPAGRPRSSSMRSTTATAS